MNQINRQKHVTGKSAGIATILKNDDTGDHAGMGIVVDPYHVITCAHVINVAQNRSPREQSSPLKDSEITVEFPMLSNGVLLKGKIIKWQPVGDDPQSDIAIVKLLERVPDEAGLAILADVTGMSLDSDTLSIFGLAPEFRIGNHVDAKFMGPTSDAWVQLDGEGDGGAFIEGGYSGAAVWDDIQQAVVGMVVAKDVSRVQRIAYMIPISNIRAVWPNVPYEPRQITSAFNRTWTVFSTLFFVLMFAVFLARQGGPAFLFGANINKQLASLIGMHIYAFLAPVLLMMLISHLKSFRLHKWYQRIPSFGNMQPGPSSTATKIGAVFSLIPLFLLPLYAQGHFIKKFHTEGRVFIYASKFGYKTEEMKIAGEKCIEKMDLCTIRNMEKYCVVEPTYQTNIDPRERYCLVLAKDGKKGGYWENAYHYGSFGDTKKKRSYTYFPILQPIIILLLTAFSILLSGRVLFLIFSQHATHPSQMPRSG
ncbi:MAG: trypsin-like peptidase domain-containing protein [Hyphomicrobiales bacterium]|nr:trypsin-like peptidase domain-containing protein [Hyphomicrobiales bacterium]